MTCPSLPFSSMDRADGPISPAGRPRPCASLRNYMPDFPVTPTTRLAGSEHSRIDGEPNDRKAPGGSGPANAEAVAKDDDLTRQEADRQGSQACNPASLLYERPDYGTGKMVVFLIGVFSVCTCYLTFSGIVTLARMLHFSVDHASLKTLTSAFLNTMR